MVQANKPVEITFKKFDLMDWTLFMGMVTACSDHLGIGHKFVDELQDALLAHMGLPVMQETETANVEGPYL